MFIILYCETGQTIEFACIRVQRHRRLAHPCAVQFRMGGCKGVLAVDPTLGDEDLIVIRPSMEKFKCSDCKLEAISFSQPRKTRFLVLCLPWARPLKCRRIPFANAGRLQRRPPANNRFKGYK